MKDFNSKKNEKWKAAKITLAIFITIVLYLILSVLGFLRMAHDRAVYVSANCLHGTGIVRVIDFIKIKNVKYFAENIFVKKEEIIFGDNCN